MTVLTKLEVLAKIKEMESKNESMKPNEMKEIGEESYKVYLYAKNFFGSWVKALSEAGVEEEKIAEVRNNVKWTKEYVIEKITERRKNGEGLMSKDLRDDGVQVLYTYGRKLFGSWEKALIASGIEPEHEDFIEGNVRWTADKIIQDIKDRYEEGLSLHRKGLVDDGEGRLYDYGRKVFGSWPEAIKKSEVIDEKVVDLLIS